MNLTSQIDPLVLKINYYFLHSCKQESTNSLTLKIWINRQSEMIKEALEMLKEVEVYNTFHRAAIELPSVQTPSQIKKFYEPVMDMEGVEITNQTKSPEYK